MHNKRNSQVNRQTFVGTKRVAVLASPDPGYIKNPIFIDPGVHYRTGNVKDFKEVIFTAPNVAITTGLAAASTTNILSAGTISATLPTTFLASGLSIVNMDYPRTLQVTSSAGVGDGTFTSATACWITIFGFNHLGLQIQEMVALNTTSTLITLKAFSAISKIVATAATGATTPTLSIGYGKGFKIPFPMEFTNDIVEIARKASAATAYTTEVLSGHAFDIGYAWAPINVAGINTDTTITIDLTNVVGSLVWTNVITPGSNVLAPNYAYTNPAPNITNYNVQELFVLGTGGTYTLTFNGQTTGTIAWNASSATIQTALTGLSSVGTSNMTVVQTSNNRYLITCAGSLTGVQPQITANQASTTGTSLFPLSGTGKWIGELDYGNNQFEEVIITGTTTGVVTVVRSADGTTAKNRFVKGAKLVVRPQMTVTPTTLTANDRLKFAYLTGAI
jgi:hypothetical protein